MGLTPIGGGSGGGLTQAAADARYIPLSEAISLPLNLSDSTKVTVGPDSVVAVEDFVNVTTVSTAIGSLGWGAFNGSRTSVAAEANHPGIIRNDTGTTASTVACMYLGTLTVGPLLTSEAAWDMTFIVRPNNVDTDTAIRIGVALNPSSNPSASHICLEKLYADTNWFRVCRSGGVQTRTDTSVAVAAAWTKLRIRRVDSSTIGFTIGAGTEQTVTTNIPSAALVPFIHIINQAAASKTVDFDYFKMTLTGLTR